MFVCVRVCVAIRSGLWLSWTAYTYYNELYKYGIVYNRRIKVVCSRSDLDTLVDFVR